MENKIAALIKKYLKTNIVGLECCTSEKMQTIFQINLKKKKFSFIAKTN